LCFQELGYRGTDTAEQGVYKPGQQWGDFSLNNGYMMVIKKFQEIGW
jgi:hypothetical protein